jgi:hypothetical protein
MQIRQLRHLTDGSINVVTKGRQRFRICKAWTEADGAVCDLFTPIFFLFWGGGVVCVCVINRISPDWTDLLYHMIFLF